MEQQLTFDAYGHILTNVACWSADGQWIVYDTRSDLAGSQFDGRRIERVHVQSGRVERLYESPEGSFCGVVTCCPKTERVVFIHGPESPTLEWQYAAYHRRGVILNPGRKELIPLDAMCYAEPFVAGALRGGSHVHTFDGSGKRVAFTYEDHLLATHPSPDSVSGTRADRETSAARQRGAERNQRNVGVCLPDQPVRVSRSHPRNHDGSHFSVLVTRTWDDPEPGSDQIDRAYEDAWVGTQGYAKLADDRAKQPTNGSIAIAGGQVEGSAKQRQTAIAFLGDLIASVGRRLTEIYLVELDDDLMTPAADGPLQGTLYTRPRPPRGARQRRLTYTTERPFPGVAGPRHWPRSSPDGSRIFFLMRDNQGIVQIWSISPLGGEPSQVTRLSNSVASAFTVSADGCWMAYISDGHVCVTHLDTGETRILSHSEPESQAPRPEACVFSPDSKHVAFIRTVLTRGQPHNQIFVARL